MSFGSDPRFRDTFNFSPTTQRSGTLSMAFRKKGHTTLRRARTPEDKDKVREAFIAAGRKLFAEEEPDTVSLRRIASAAGYAPAAIYQYFEDQADLFFHIRSQDMQAATEYLRRLTEGVIDPEVRVKTLFVGVADYWLAHMDHFMNIFPVRIQGQPVPRIGGLTFGQSKVVQDSLALHYGVVDALFSTFTHPPLPARQAADLLIASVYGSIAFPEMTRTMEWSDLPTLIRTLVDTIVDSWVAQGVRKRK